MALISIEDYLQSKNVSPTAPTTSTYSGGFISADDYIAGLSAQKVTPSVTAPTSTKTVTPSVSKPTTSYTAPYVTPQQPIAPPKDVDISSILRPTGYQATPTGLTPQEIGAKAVQSGGYFPTLPDLKLEKAQTATDRDIASIKEEALSIKQKSLQDQLAEINKSIGFKTDPEVVSEQTKLQAELQDVSAELNTKTLGVAEGLSKLLPVTKTFTETQQERRELFGQAPSTGIEKAKESTGFQTASVATQLAGNVLLYTGLNQAVKGIGAASKLGKVLGIATKGPKGKAIATFAGTQVADLFVDVMAQAPKEIMDSIADDDTLSEFAKKELTNRGIDVGINLLIGGFISKDMLQEAFKSVDPTLIPASTKRLADQMGVEAKTIQQELGIPEGMTYEQFMRGQKNLATEIAEVSARKGKPKYKSYRELFSNTFTRNIKNTFGEGSTAWKMLVEPLEKAKKGLAEDVQMWAKELDVNIVKKFGITKGSTESAAVQKIGERVITLEQLQASFPTKWKQISQASDWFRSRYDTLLAEVNKARAIAYGPGKEIPARQDYFRHMQELSGDQTKVKSMFERDAEGPANIFKGGDFAKPQGKTSSMMKERTGEETVYDAVGGYLNYIPMAGYAKHIDPYTKQVVDFTEIFTSKPKPKSAESFVKYLEDFSDGLTGKPTAFESRFGDSGFVKSARAVNGLAKKNAILYNLSTTAMQAANIPNALALLQDPVSSLKGVKDFLGSAGGGGHKSLYDDSGFLKERFGDKLLRSFDNKLKDQPEKFSRWLLEVVDEMSTKYIWSSAYEKAIKNGELDPSLFADRLTKDAVAGRGVADIPMLQKSFGGQMAMPFTIEVANELAIQKEFWQNLGTGVVGKDLKKAKQGAIGLITLYMGNFLFNNVMENITGYRPKMDVIDAVIDTAEDEDANVGTYAGRIAGEQLSNIPGGAWLAKLYPEYGIADVTPTRSELFGESDPGRFGSPLLAVSAISNPARYLLSPFGGGSQFSKSMKTLRSADLLPLAEPGTQQSLLDASQKEIGARAVQSGEFELPEERVPVTGTYTKDFSKLRKAVDFTPATLAKSLAFGTSSLQESKDFYDKEQRQLSERQTIGVTTLQNEHNISAKEAVDFLQAVRSAGADSKKEWNEVLDGFSFTRKEERAILDNLFPKSN